MKLSITHDAPSKRFNVRINGNMGALAYGSSYGLDDDKREAFEQLGDLAQWAGATSFDEWDRIKKMLEFQWNHFLEPKQPSIADQFAMAGEPLADDEG